MPVLRAVRAAVVVIGLMGCRQSAGTLPADWESQLLTIREQVWRDWFDGNARLGERLTDDFVGIGFGAGPWDTRASTLEGSKEFAASGSRLLSLEFPRTTTQAMGDAVVMYSDYSLRFASSTGEQTVQQGRATEVFRWQDGRWVHPGWHLDSGQ